MPWRPGVLFGCSVMVLLLAAPRQAFAASGGAPEMPSIASQSDLGRNLKVPAPQALSSPATALEVMPQPVLTGAPKADELPVDRLFRQSADAAARDDSMHVGQPGETRRPYLGITVQYTTKCYLGGEEHGLEVQSVYPGSPGSVAGLHGSKPASTLSVVGAAMLGPIAVMIKPLLQQSGAFGSDGDLIIGVDDKRVRTAAEFDAAMLKLKPGDTMYLTVIRPLPGGNHKTMKIAIKIGRETMQVAKSSATPHPESEAENYAY
jgi:S1-C subfamily serine protease